LLDYSINLRLAQPEAGSVVVPWRVHAIEFAGIQSLELTVDAPTDAEGLAAVNLPATGAGLAAGLLATLALIWLKPRNWSALAALEAVAGEAVVAAGLLVGQGLAFGLRTGWLGVMSFIAGAVLLGSLLARRPRMARPGYWAAPIALLALPIASAGFVLAGEFRPADAIAIFGTVGFVIAVGVAEVIFYFRPVVATLPLWRLRNWFALVVAAATISITLGWALLISTGATGLSVFVAIPFGLVCLVQIAGLVLWLHGRSTESIVVGILITLGAGVEFAALVSYTFTNLFGVGFADGLAFVESCAVVAICGVLFAVFGSFPLILLKATSGAEPGSPA
jgi:hypothetical protein